MTELACPQCGASIAFRAADLPVRICDYCRSAIVRDGEALRAAGKSAIVPEDVSPLQIGVRGRHDGMAFELVGRVRWRWSDGAWNEWLALFGDGTIGWLGESMGRFMMLRAIGHDARRTAIVRQIAEDRAVAVGAEAQIDGVAYVVADIRDVTCVASEGALPQATATGTKARSVDLMARDGRCASVQREDGATFVYAGRYVSLADIAAIGLRAFDGWPMPRHAA